MASRFKTPQLAQVGFPYIHANWKAALIIVAIFSVVLLPVWGSVVARIQSATFPYPGLVMNFNAVAVDRLDGTPTYRNLTVQATFQDLHSYAGNLLLKVTTVTRDSTVTTLEKYIDIITREEYVALAAIGGSVVVPASVYTVLWIPKDAVVGELVAVNSFVGRLEGPVELDSFGRQLPFGKAFAVRTAEGSFYYSTDARVLQRYESNVALTPQGSTFPVPLRSVTLVSYNDVASQGTLQGLQGSLVVLAAVLIVFGLHRDIDRRRNSRLKGLRNRIRSLSDVLEDQYLLGFINRETYMRRQVVLRRLASDIELEAGAKPNNEGGLASGDGDRFAAP